MSALGADRIRAAACGCRYDVVTELTVAHCRRHERKERYCEDCGATMGVMTGAGWAAAGRVCDPCAERHDALGEPLERGK